MPFIVLVVMTLGLWALYFWSEQDASAGALPELHEAPSARIPAREMEEAALLRGPILKGRATRAPHARDLSQEHASCDEIEEELEWVGVPDDPRSGGSCSLGLRVVDTTGMPVTTWVELYRLDAPATEFYSRGDQHQARVRYFANAPDVNLDSLPKGRYRAFLHALAFDAEDPPAFDVAGARTEIELVLAQRPKSHSAYLRVFDHRGREVLEGALLEDFPHGTIDEAPRPSWARERRVTPPPPGSEYMECPDCGELWFICGSAGPTPKRVTASVSIGFALGEQRDDSRVNGTTQPYVFSRTAWTNVHAEHHGALRADHTLVATQVPLGRIEDLVWLPTGSRACDHPKASFSAVSVGVQSKQATDSVAWLDAPIKIEVKVPGYRDFELSFTLREGWPEPVELKRAPAREASE